jgi:hypothetical protein
MFTLYLSLAVVAVSRTPGTPSVLTLTLTADTDCGTSCASKAIVLVMRNSTYNTGSTNVVYCTQSQTAGATPTYTLTYTDSAWSGTGCTVSADIASLIDSGKIVIQAQLAATSTLVLPIPSTTVPSGVTISRSAAVSSSITVPGAETITVGLSGSQASCTVFNVFYQTASTPSVTDPMYISRQSYTSMPNQVISITNMDTLVVTGPATIPRPVVYTNAAAATTWVTAFNKFGFVGITCEINGIRYYELFHVNSVNPSSPAAAANPQAVPTSLGAVYDGIFNNFVTSVYQTAVPTNTYWAGAIVQLQMKCDTVPASSPSAILSSQTVDVIPSLAEITAVGTKLTLTRNISVSTSAATMLALL